MYILRLYYLLYINHASILFLSKEDEYLGELLVSLTYLAQAERLNVGIIEARNLKALSMHIEAGLLLHFCFSSIIIRSFVFLLLRSSSSFNITIRSN